MTEKPDEKVRAEAEHWFAKRLEPSVSDAERAAFERWHQEHPGHAEAYAETERLWRKLEILKQSERLRAAASPSAGFPECSASSRYRAFISLAAGLAAIAILTLIWLDRGVPTQTFTSALGQQRTETLADGTILRLNTNTTLDVQLSDEQRVVTLRSGEAAFDVAKDATRPFIVAAGDGTVTAVGTHFQVRHEQGAVEVSLIEGRVQLARPAREEVEWLDPGQQATFSDGASGIVRRNVDIRVLTSWMDGRLEFRATPLEQAVLEANRYSARKIRIGDPALEQLPVSGTFIAGDVNAMAEALAAAFPVRVQNAEHEVVLFRRAQT